ncbi:2-isopropylmalate synthase [Nodularia spumigena CS-591/04]|uniref:2-isopropylmalate synthase n=2 Tax=Nodularia spumigena TaxID=70799 RepID=UPI0023308E13|nr:2-isopropylmalate synthase [Nodularia spumigena]MDB9320817.1 2-isopropylmalate synthase [Nodularia spumigena CS-591/07A]MDB9332655.1 2-isopropylmalate synthase [Nodularia spumigena CS-591/04]MDB9361319.1 2-isopropylmalate synthase [Nodularia spumigena CS-588/02]MDB9366575.1 2-isopropylmalate synthase [Nodularia spumigena CS-588/02A10]
MDKVFIFDTTMRDGELTPGVKMTLQQKISLSQLLEEMGVDIIEVAYPASSPKDFAEVFNIAKIIKNSTICGLANSQETEIITLAEALKPALSSRIHTYTQVNIKHQSKLSEEQVLTTIKNSVSLARNYCNDVEWSAFDAPRSEPDFLCKSIEAAIKSGAKTISIPDSLGLASPAEFSQLLQMIFNRVPNIDQAIVAVHCHNDLGMAVDNSLIALNCGVIQIECAINGLGARKGNADLEKVVTGVLKQGNYQIDIYTLLLTKASELVLQITG